MSNITELFKELRKQNYTARQRAGDCRSCVLAEDPAIEVYTTDQSYHEDYTMVYFQVIEGNIIQKALAKLDIPFVWDGSDATAFKVMEPK